MKEIPLTQGKVAIVDDADADLAAHKWFAQNGRATYYAQRWGRVHTHVIIMHRVIVERMGVDISSQIIDHINGNGLDNRRSNLRAVSLEQNSRNRRMHSNNKSGFRGVCWDRSHRKWVAQLNIKGKNFKLGRFAIPEEAARAYDRKAKELFGDFAHLNFPEDI